MDGRTQGIAAYSLLAILARSEVNDPLSDITRPPTFLFIMFVSLLNFVAV